MIILAALAFLACEIGGLNNYIYQGYLGILFVCIFLAYKITKIHWLPGLLFLYVSVLSLLYTMVPYEFYHGDPSLDITIVMGLQILNTNGFIYILICVLPFLFLNKEGSDHLGASFWLLGFIDSLIMLFKIIQDKTAHGELMAYWLFNNPAMDTAFISCCIPFFIDSVARHFNYKKHLIVVCIPIFVCLYVKTSTGVLGVGVSVAGYYWAKNGFKKIEILYASLIAGGTALIGYLMQRNVLFIGSGRYEIWRDSFKFWQGQHDSAVAPHIPGLIGSGIGSFFMYGPSLQMQTAIDHKIKGLDVFFWLHNDWAQILFETGYIGLILTLSVFFLALWKARKTPAIFAGLLTYGSVALIQMPIRSYIFAIFGLWLLYKAFLKSTPKTADKK